MRAAHDKMKEATKSKKPEWEYLLHFDPSVNLEPMWVDETTHMLLIQNREDINYMPHHTQPKRKKRGKRPDIQYCFCHQCKQRVPETEVFTCAYNHGPAVPEKMIEGTVMAYNIEAYNT